MRDGLKINQSGEGCWDEEIAKPPKKAPKKDSPELIDGYFEPESPSIVLVFDREVQSKHTAKKQPNLKIELIEETGDSTTLNIKSTKYEGNKKISFFDFPKEEVINSSIRVSTLREKTSRRSKSKKQKNGGGKRVLGSVEDKKRFKATTTPTNSILTNNLRMLESEDKGGHQENTNDSSPFTILIERISYYNPPQSQDIKIFGELLAWISTGLSLLLFLLHPPGALSLIQLIQAVTLLRFVNTDLPANLLILTKELSQNPFTIIPKPFKFHKSISTCKPNRVFYRIEDFSCNALEGNIPVMAALLITLLITKTILRGMLVYTVKSTFREKKRINAKKFSQNLKKKIGKNFGIKILVKMNLVVSRRFIIYFAMAAQMDALFTGLVAIRYPGKQKDQGRGSNLGIGFVALVCYLIFFWCLGENFYKERQLRAQNLTDYRKKKAEGIEVKGYCFGEFRDNETTPLLVHSLSMALYGALVGVVVLAAEFTMAQCFLVLSVLVCLLVAHSTLRPYSSPVYLTLSIARFAVLTIVALAITAKRLTSLTPKEAYSRIGLTTVALIGLIITVEIIYQVVVVLNILREPSKVSLTEKSIQKAKKILKYNLSESTKMEKNGEKEPKDGVDRAKMEQRIDSQNAKKLNFGFDEKKIEDDFEIPEESCLKKLTLNKRVRRYQSIRLKKGITTRFQTFVQMELSSANNPIRSKPKLMAEDRPGDRPEDRLIGGVRNQKQKSGFEKNSEDFDL